MQQQQHQDQQNQRSLGQLAQPGELQILPMVMTRSQQRQELRLVQALQLLLLRLGQLYSV